ncbi:MAG: hypothetical protein EHM62_06105 [Methylococcus sp.]|nr:MAG: hypothetical protein EHM62_06105 [Methylococcus sp.]
MNPDKNTRFAAMNATLPPRADASALIGRRFRRLLLITLLLSGTGCTKMMTEKQGKPKAEHAAACPRVFGLTRLDSAALDWAFSENPQPDDPCLSLYYPKAAQDSLYQNSTRWMTPGILLGMPVDVVVDTVTLPLSVTASE